VKIWHWDGAMTGIRRKKDIMAIIVLEIFVLQQESMTTLKNKIVLVNMVTSCLTARIVSVSIQQTPVYVPFPE
jgi:hypothetical protein